MKTTQRSYREDAGDFARLCRLMVDVRREGWQSSTWCLGRMVDWRYGLWGGKLERPDFWGRNARLWLDAFGDLAGLVIAENGDANIAVITAPGHRFLFAELLDWALEAWAARGPRFTVEITEAQELEARALERRGFRNQGPFLTRRFDLGLAPAGPPALEPGFSIVDMRSHPDYAGRRRLRVNAFDRVERLGDEELARMLELDAYALESPIYRPECDICVMAPGGELVAGCEALLDARNAEADIERVCTHSAFRNRGLARAAILACMGRLREMGLRRAYITGYSEAAMGLYGSMGHTEELRCFTYERRAEDR